jgi:hypothetical protein
VVGDGGVSTGNVKVTPTDGGVKVTTGGVTVTGDKNSGTVVGGGGVVVDKKKVVVPGVGTINTP